MNDPSRGREPQPDGQLPDEDNGNTISPLPGEPGIPDVTAPQRVAVSRKGLLAVALVILMLVAALAFTVHRLSAGGKKAEDADSKLVRERPAAATAEPRKLDIPAAPRPAA